MGSVSLKNKRILVTGGSGLVGSQLVAELRRQGHKVAAPTHKEYDLENRQAVTSLFSKEKPELVFHLAAKVGGIKANMADPVGFLTVNNLITTHVFEACRRLGVQKVAHLNSSCVYPREAPQPIREEHLLTGPLEPTNEPYALAKIGALKLGQAYHKQHGLLVVCPVAAGIYGPGDHFDLDRSHVLSALVLRFAEAKAKGIGEVTLWGSGSPRRQFVHVHDVVRGLIFFMEQIESSEPFNMGDKEDISIKELAALIAELIGYQGKILWDTSKPDGMPRKWMSTDRLGAMGFLTKIPLRQGIMDVIQDHAKFAAAQKG